MTARARSSLRLLIAFAALSATFGARMPAAWADALLPNEKSIDYCFQVSNTADFPDYVLIAAFGPPGYGYQLVQAGDCVHPQRSATLYAAKKSEFNQAQIPPQGTAQAAYFTTSPQIIRPGYQVPVVRTVPKSDRRTSITDTLRVVTLTDTTLQVEQVRSAASNPTPATGRAFSVLWFALLPLVALLGIAGGVLLFRRR
jgi:LPXTG-motif cell wall-anchored protein